jgi:hypothetical protein
MRISSFKTRTGSMAVASAAAISLWLALAGPAQAEVADPTASAVAAQGQAPSAATLPASTEAVSAAPESAVEAVSSPPAQPEAAPAPAPDPVSETVSKVSETTSKAAAPIEAEDSLGVERVEATAKQVTTKVVEEVQRVETAGAEAVSAGLNAAPSAGDLAAPTAVHRALKQAPSAESLSELTAQDPEVTVHDQGSPASAAPAGGPGSSPGAALELGHEAFLPGLPGVLDSPSGNQVAGERIEGQGGFDGARYLRLQVQNGLLDPPAGPGPAMVAAAHAPIGGATDRPSDHAPLEGPGPSPGSSESAASGTAGSFFVPLAALLALLALAAPAILRRLREAPEFSAPAPFVCALERPG